MTRKHECGPDTCGFASFEDRMAIRDDEVDPCTTVVLGFDGTTTDDQTATQPERSKENA